MEFIAERGWNVTLTEPTIDLTEVAAGVVIFPVSTVLGIFQQFFYLKLYEKERFGLGNTSDNGQSKIFEKL